MKGFFKIHQTTLAMLVLCICLASMAYGQVLPSQPPLTDAQQIAQLKEQVALLQAYANTCKNQLVGLVTQSVELSAIVDRQRAQAEAATNGSGNKPPPEKK